MLLRLSGFVFPARRKTTFARVRAAMYFYTERILSCVICVYACEYIRKNASCTKLDKLFTPTPALASPRVYVYVCVYMGGGDTRARVLGIATP